MYDNGCVAMGDLSDAKACSFGSSGEKALRVALVGNSHASHWLPTAQQIDETIRPVEITTYFISTCYTSDLRLALDSPVRRDNCSAWNKRVIDEIAVSDYDLVVISNRTRVPVEGMDFARRFRSPRHPTGGCLDGWTAAGVPVLVLRDTPYATELDNVPRLRRGRISMICRRATGPALASSSTHSPRQPPHEGRTRSSSCST